MTTTITVEDLEKNLEQVPESVRERGDKYNVVKNGKVLAVIGPPEVKAYTVGDLVRDFGDLRMPEGLGDAIEDARKALGPLPEPPAWPDS